MEQWRNLIRSMTDDVDEYFEALTNRLRSRLGSDPLHIVPYRGFGTADRLYLRGRVLEDEGLGAYEDNDQIWHNLVDMYKRFESDEIAGARVRIQVQNSTTDAVTDSEGYFDVELPLAEPLVPSDSTEEGMWHQVSYTLLGGATPNAATVTAEGQVMVPSVRHEFGVISDLDDTVLQTHATNLLKMARVTFLNNARTRLPFPGVAAFYRALQRGASGHAHNPVFYVSSSPWNLYDLLVDFMALQNIPSGPLFLRDFSISRQSIGEGGHHDHKLAQIHRLMTTYPETQFILIGDSGQKDPEIYREAVRQFPARVAAIYIRDVSLEDRDVEVDAIVQEIGRQDVEMVRVADTVAAAEHAVKCSFLDAGSLAAIREDKIHDTA